jgi:hypothetical protein
MKRYNHINFTPPESVAKAAEKGLEYRKRSGGSISSTWLSIYINIRNNQRSRTKQIL